MRNIGLPLAATATAIGLTLTACSSGPPGAEDIAEQLIDSGAVTDEEQADCIAEELVDSDLTDDQLNAIADDNQADLSGDDVTAVGEALERAIISCNT